MSNELAVQQDSLTTDVEKMLLIPILSVEDAVKLAAQYKAKVEGMSVTNQEQRIAMGVLFRGAKDGAKRAEEHFSTSCTSAHKAWQDALALRKSATLPLEAAANAAEARMKEWDDLQERIAKQLALKAAEEQRKRNEEEALARALEEQARADRAKVAAEALKEIGDEEGAEEYKAKAEEATEAAEQALTYIPEPVTVMAPAPKIAGETTARTWKGCLVNKLELVKAVAADPSLLALLDVSESELNRLARQRQGENPPAGVEFKQDRSYRS